MKHLEFSLLLSTRSWRPCHGAVAILFAHESQAKMKSVTRVVTGFSRQTSHASGMEALTRRDLRSERHFQFSRP